MEDKKKLLSVIILTMNEELNLPFCLESLKGLNADVFVVDSGSTDRTDDIAKSFGVCMVGHPFENYARQFNWALSNLPITTPWCMRLDADENLTRELVAELRNTLPVVTNETMGFIIKRRVHFLGRWMRHGCYYPVWLLRVWRTGTARCEDRWMDEHMVISQGSVISLKNDIIDENHKGLSFWVEKHNHYADREVRDLLMMHRGQRRDELLGQPASRRRLKRNLYCKAPLFFRAFLYWFYRYFFCLGFLDGLPGLVFHFLQAFWYRFLVDAKLYELRKRKIEAQS